MIKNAMRELMAFIFFIKNLLVEIFKATKNATVFIFSSIKSNLLTLKKVTYTLLVFAILWFIFDSVVRYYDLFDMNIFYNNLVYGALEFDAFIHKLYWIPYRHVRFYVLSLLIPVGIELEIILGAFVKNFVFFKNFVATNPSYEETTYIAFIWILINYWIAAGFVFLFSLGKKREIKTEVVSKGFHIKKVFILTKFLSFLTLKTSIIFTWFYINIKKVILFFYRHSFKYLFNFLNAYLTKSYNAVLLFWKPVFKKWSYYGIYRTYKSKWLKK